MSLRTPCPRVSAPCAHAPSPANWFQLVQSIACCDLCRFVQFVKSIACYDCNAAFPSQRRHGTWNTQTHLLAANDHKRRLGAAVLQSQNCLVQLLELGQGRVVCDGVAQQKAVARSEVAVSQRGVFRLACGINDIQCCLASVERDLLAVVLLCNTASISTSAATPPQRANAPMVGS